MIEIHPAANAYRMHTDDEIEGLTESIKTNGLRDPLTIGVINGNKWLIDGRNRTKACEIAGVEPRYEEIRFADEVELRAFVADRNERRNITAGQKAMGYARLFPEPAKGGRGKTVQPLNSFSKAMLSYARAVKAFSEEWADEVTEGTLSLNAAFERVQAERERKATDAERLVELSASAPDLAALVAEERMTLAEAFAAKGERDRRRREEEAKEREDYLREIQHTMVHLLWWSEESIAKAKLLLNDEEFAREIKIRVGNMPEYQEKMARAAKLFLAFIKREFQP